MHPTGEVSARTIGGQRAGGKNRRHRVESAASGTFSLPTAGKQLRENGVGGGVRLCHTTKTPAAAIRPIVAGKDLERQSLRPETALIEGARFESEVGAGPPREIPHPNFRPDAEPRQ